VRAAYNHAQYLPERRKMMQWWADYLDGIPQKKSTPSLITQGFEENPGFPIAGL